VLKHEGVGLRLKSSGVVVNLGGGVGDGVGLLGMAPDFSGLDGVGCL